MALHLIKLAVGCEAVDDIRRYQAMRLANHGQVFHLTRAVPKRTAELLDGGSIYWVVRGVISARQRILDVVEQDDEEGRRQCRLVLFPDLVEVERRPHKAFQGWRYLDATDTPPDRPEGAEEPPPEMAAELRRLGLL